MGKVTNGTGIWTELNPLVPRTNYIGLHFVNKDTGWACGGSGAIIKTTNGGRDWTISETPVTNLLLKIHSFDGQVVICTGYDGIILRSSDGGENFAQVVSGVSRGIDLWGVKMVNDTLGWVCGTNAILLKTTDAGQTWQPVTPGLNDHYWSLDFLSENYGMIACGGGKILKTTNGGNNWTQTQAGDTRALFTIDIIDSLHIAAAGVFGKNVYSSDAGNSWVINTDIPAFSATNWIDFVDTDTGYSVQDVTNMKKTTNRGQTWFNPAVNNLENICEWHIQLLQDGTGYACGEEIGGFYALNFYKRTNGLDNWSRIFLNVNWSDIFFINETVGFLISRDVINGGLYKTSDGGMTYQKIEDAPNGPEILFLDSLTGFIGSNLIYKTTDGGETWFTPNGGSGGAGKIFFVNDTIGWAIRSNVIYKTTDRGENWFTQFTGTNNFTSIYFIDTLNGWATSRYIWQTTDGGDNWIERTDIPITFSDDVFFPNLDTGWIARNSSVNYSLFKTTNGGLSWIAIPEILGAMNFYYFPDNVHWLITGAIVQNYVVYKKYMTYDNGNYWIDFSDEVPVGFSGISTVTDYLGFAVGSSGLVLRYDDTTYVPVELVSFQGESINNDVTLRWQTASEINNNGFEIERSLSKNKSNQEDWLKIVFVNGYGTTTEPHFYTFTDESLTPGKYQYRLKQIDYDGSFEYSEIVEVTVREPREFLLFQNYPNPFNPSTTIKFDLPKAGNAELIIYDILGRKVTTLLNETKQAGRYEVKWDATKVASGVYIYQLKANEFISSKKMILLK